MVALVLVVAVGLDLETLPRVPAAPRFYLYLLAWGLTLAGTVGVIHEAIIVRAGRVVLWESLLAPMLGLMMTFWVLSMQAGSHPAIEALVFAPAGAWNFTLLGAVIGAAWAAWRWRG